MTDKPRNKHPQLIGVVTFFTICIGCFLIAAIVVKIAKG